jgi:hypothetical protein
MIRFSLFEANSNRLGLDGYVLAPEGHPHDGFDDLDPGIESLEIFGFVRRTQQIRVGGVGLLDAHLVGKASRPHVLRHLRAAAELVDERLIEPGLVDAQLWVGQQAIAVEPLDVVALERAAIAPDVHVVLLHGDDEHRPGDGAAEGSGIEIRHAGRGDMKRAALQRGNPLGHQLAPAIDQPRFLGAVLEGLARNRLVIRLIRLPEVGRVGKRDRALVPHPVQRSAGVQAARERDAHLFATW